VANQRSKDMIVGAIAGAVLGAATALLLAPKSGRELRADIAHGCQQVGEKTQQLASSTVEATQQAVKQVGSRTSEWVGKAKELSTQVVDQVRSWKEGSKQEVEAEAALEDTGTNENEQGDKVELTLIR
jgi:gas vesicle protein